MSMLKAHTASNGALMMTVCLERNGGLILINSGSEPLPRLPADDAGHQTEGSTLAIRVYRLEEPSRCNSKRIRIPR
jgi:hypothetical protein